LIFFLAACALGGAWPVSAQISGTLSKEVIVTATVPSRTPPPVPILVRPENNSFINTGTVDFMWRAVSGHDVLLARYEISVNGVKLFDLPLGNDESVNYSFTLNNGIYRLVLKNPARLPDGTHTWKIRVLDDDDKGTDSATWQFTVDSSQPPIVITNINGQEVSISASDPVTIPESPVIVTSSQPFIYGTTESQSEVQLVVRRTDGSESYYKMQSTSDGRFLFTLPVLNADEIVTLTITVIDRADNSRVLSGLQIQYVPRRFVLPLPDFIPDQPDIVITIPDIPGIVRPTPPFLRPTPSPSPAPGGVDPAAYPGAQQPTELIVVVSGQQVFERPVTFLGGWRWLLIFLLWGYTLWVYLWTGNRWIWYFPWLLAFGRWVILWKDPEFIMLSAGGNPIPWGLTRLEWLKSDSRYERRYVWTTPTGFWQVPPDMPAQGVILTVENPHWVWPGGSELTRLRVNPKSGSQQWRWKFRWWPRIWILATVLVAAWLAYRVPVAETFTWLGICLWFFIRDIQGRLPERWRAWQEGA
jgi:hypothetical protein